jgi:hypothetical protein
VQGGRRTWGGVGGSFLDQICVAFSTKARSLIKYYTFVLNISNRNY